MKALAIGATNAGDLAQAVSKANPGLRADGVRITTDRQGWLDEIWICLDKAFAYTRCPAHQGGRLVKHDDQDRAGRVLTASS